MHADIVKMVICAPTWKVIYLRERCNLVIFSINFLCTQIVKKIHDDNVSLIPKRTVSLSNESRFIFRL